MLHRDLKPSNALVDSSDSVHFTDFGLTRKVQADSGLTRTGRIVGTPRSTAPVQAQAKQGLRAFLTQVSTRIASCSPVSLPGNRCLTSLLLW